MPDINITRTQIITVDKVSQNSYGDLTFTDKEGKEYKISAKRKQYFAQTILPNKATQLNYTVFKGREYIYSAELIEDKLQVRESPKKSEPLSPPPLSKDAQIERAVWIKEAGECVRANDIDKTTPMGKSLRDAYYAEMFRVLGINKKGG